MNQNYKDYIMNYKGKDSTTSTDMVILFGAGILLFLVILGVITFVEDPNPHKDLKAYTCIQGVVYEIGKTGNLYIQHTKHGPKRCFF